MRCHILELCSKVYTKNKFYFIFLLHYFFIAFIFAFFSFQRKNNWICSTPEHALAAIILSNKTEKPSEAQDKTNVSYYLALMRQTKISILNQALILNKRNSQFSFILFHIKQYTSMNYSGYGEIAIKLIWKSVIRTCWLANLVFTMSIIIVYHITVSP